MPVEIRELLVRTTIESAVPKKEKAPSSSGPTTGDAPSTPAPAPASSGGDRSQAKMHERLLKECVNMIMDNIASLPKER